ncbi:MAG: HYR domain-containing protein [Bacteroidetes bacterium]|nr:MAG: HYR domain-containing protein [Bacteroidota bacterium]
MRLKLLPIVFLFLTFNLFSQDWQLLPDHFITNGTVTTIEIDTAQQLAYVAGEFSKVGPPTFYGAIIDTNGQARLETDDFNGVVNVAKSYNNNSWIVGGSFTKVGESLRSYLAQIDSNGIATNMFKSQGLDGFVKAIEIKDSILFVGGEFESVGRSVQFNAFVEHSSSNLDYYQAQANNTVYQIIEIPEGGWIVAGAFNQYGDSIRNGLVKLNPDKTISTWAPNIRGDVRSLFLIGDTLIIAGNFDLVNGETRSNIAAFNRQTETLLAWAPVFNGLVLDIDIYQNEILVSGYFSEINGITRNHIGSVDRFTGVVSNFNPNTNFNVRSIAVHEQYLYVVGNFTSIYGQSRNRVAKINLETNALQNWSPSVNSEVYVVEVDNDFIFIGGQFSTVSGMSRISFAAFSTNTGQLLNNLQCQLNGNVHSIKRFENKLVLCGGFSKVNNITRTCVAELDILSNSLTDFSINISCGPGIVGSCEILDVSSSNGEYFIGGNTNFIGGQRRQGFAAFNLNNGTLMDLDIPVLGYIESIAIKDSLLLLGGSFSQILNQPSNYFGIVNINSNSLLPTLIQPNSFIQDIHLIEDTVYIGGFFTSINGQSRSRIAAFNLYDQQLLNWSPNFDNTVTKIKRLNNLLLVGGEFTNVNGNSTGHAVCLSRNTNTIENIGLQYTNGRVYDFYSHNNKLHIVGAFTNFGSENREYYAVLDLNTALLDATDPNPTSKPYCIAAINNSIFVGGSFTSIGTTKRNKIAAIDLTTGQVTGWAPNIQPNSCVINDIVIDNNEVYVAGYFTSVNDEPRTSFVSLSKFDASVLPTDPNLNFNGVIFDMTLKDSLVYFIGMFSSVSGVPKNRVAAFNVLTNSLSSWDPPISGNSPGSVIEYIYDRIFIADIRLLSDLTTELIAEFDPVTGIPMNSYAIETSAAPIHSIDNYGDTLVIAGGIFSFAGQAVNKIVLFDHSNQQIIPFNPLISITVLPYVDIYQNEMYVYDDDLQQYFGSNRIGIAEQSLNDLNITKFKQNTIDIGTMKRSDDFLILGLAKVDEFDYGNSSRLSVFQKCNLPIMGNILTANEFCLGDEITLELENSNLNDANTWVWYIDEIGSDPIGIGSSITLTPQESTKIIVRGEGGCVQRQTGINTILRLDNSPPIIENCPSDQTIPFDSPGCTAVANWVEPTVTDNCPGSILTAFSHTPGSFFQHGITPVTYTFIDTAGNSSYCIFNINVTSSLSFSGVSQDVDCHGESTGSIDITTTGGSTPYIFNWNNGQFVTEDIINLNTGTYNLSLTDANGCDFDTTFIISEPEILDTSVVVTGTTIVSTNTSPGATYSWVDCTNNYTPLPGQTNQVFNVIQSGIYAVQITQNGCSNIGSCYDYSDLSLNSLETQQTQIYPNPTNDFFKIVTYEVFNELSILDLTGKRLKSFQKPEKNETFSIAEFPAGLYFVELSSDNKKIRMKVIKD